MHLSPSDVHQHLMRKATPTLQYDGGDVKAWQRKLRRKLRQLLGYDNMPKERVALTPRSLWKREHPLGSIEKVCFASEPKADVTAYLCLPKDIAPPYACVISLQGHNVAWHQPGRKCACEFPRLLRRLTECRQAVTF